MDTTIETTTRTTTPLTRKAQPVLASALIEDAVLDNIITHTLNSEKKSAFNPREGNGKGANANASVRIGVGLKSVDDALNGGLEMGSVVAVSEERATGGGGGELTLSLLVSTLLTIPNSAAAIIDTTGNLDVLRIYTLLLTRLQHDEDLWRRQQALYDDEQEGKEEMSAEERKEKLAAKFLDRVKIMRVFDLVGVVEAVGEIRDGLEGKSKAETKGKVTEEQKFENAVEVQEDNQKEKEKMKKTVIADSEGEEDEDEEMLFEFAESTHVDTEPQPEPELEPTGNRHRPVDSKPVAKFESATKPETQTKPHESGAAEPRVSFILLSTLSHVLSPLLKKDFVHGNILASALLRTLTNLTHTHSLLTVLQNPASPPRQPQTYKTTLKDADADTVFSNLERKEGGDRGRRNEIPPHPSIFTSNPLIPALGNILAPFVDVHLLVSELPKRKIDAKTLAKYADANTRGTKVRGVKMVGVVEVLADRASESVGGWGTFVSDGDQGLVGV